MIKQYKFYTLLLLLVVTIAGFSCKEQDILTYIDDSTPVPALVSDIQTGGLPGGAYITYTIPNDKNLLYIKATYEIRPGVVHETKGSYFEDSLFVEGFGNTESHPVTITSVGRNGKESEPQVVNVTPLTPPLISTFEELHMQETFGGAAIKFVNSAKANLAYVILSDSTGNGNWYTVDTYYSKAALGAVSVRGFDTTKRRFAVYIRDRWDNKSDTLIKDLVPLFESALPKSKFKELKLPNDNAGPHTFSGRTWVMTYLWDGGDDNGGNNGNIFHTAPSQGIPSTFTFDLGASYTLSRFKFYHRGGNNNIYTRGDPKVFKVWGSNNPSLDGSWSSWDSIGTFTSFKPSGLPVGQYNADDTKFAVDDGENFDMPIGTPPYRYLRYTVTEVWGPVSYFYIPEFSFWGSPAKTN